LSIIQGAGKHSLITFYDGTCGANAHGFGRNANLGSNVSATDVGACYHGVNDCCLESGGGHRNPVSARLKRGDFIVSLTIGSDIPRDTSRLIRYLYGRIGKDRTIRICNRTSDCSQVCSLSVGKKAYAANYSDY
jgi:hypothetical protein